MALKQILIWMVYALLILLVILFIVSITRCGCERFTSKTSASNAFPDPVQIIPPSSTRLFIAQQNNRMLTLSPQNQNLRFHLGNGTIQILGSNRFLDFDRIHLLTTLYLVYLVPSQQSLRHKWNLQKTTGNNQFFIYQKIRKQNVFLFISNDSLIGDTKNKTPFTIVRS